MFKTDTVILSIPQFSGCQERRPLPYPRRVPVPLFSPIYFSTSTLRHIPESTDGPLESGKQKSKANDESGEKSSPVNQYFQMYVPYKFIYIIRSCRDRNAYYFS